MIIYNRDGSVLADLWLQESSFVNEEIMGDHSAQIDFLSRYPIDLEIGDYIEHEGNIYTLRHKESVTKRETSLGWDYSVVMYSARYELQDVPFFLSDEPQYLKNGDYYTGTASDWLNLIIRNMNREISGWAAGSCVESEWITISFKDKQCSEVLDELCAQLDTEWQVIGRTLSIGRVEYPSDGLVLSQGEGGGLKELRLSSSNQERPVTVLYPYGSDKNLPEGYGSDYLLLPGGQKVMERNVDKYGRCGMKVQFNVYPKGEFTVTSVMDDLTFTADGIDFDISSCLIPEQEVTVSFQSGALAGYDLAIAEDGWDNATKQITVLQNEEENALKVPGDIHIAVGDRFELFNLRMPQSYVTKAKEELKAKADAWLAKKSEKEVRLSAKCDDILFRQCGVRIRCGQMVRILSLELDMDREIRVTKVKRHIENDCPTYRYELTLSDFLDTNGFKQLVKEVENVPEEIKTETKPFKAWTRRSWRDVMETLSMMFDPEGDYFTELIKPLAVHTAQLIVGTNSQQMDLVGVRFIPNKGGNANLFAATAGKLVHFTISEKGVREWIIPATADIALREEEAYYVYAKCSRTGTEGQIICSTQQIKLEDDPNYYHFLVGILNTPYDGSRSWNPSYGYTEISGETITTGVIKDKNGTFAINLNDGTITGWGSMTDKPDMTQYATVSWANGEFKTFVKGTDYNGETIVSYINQTADTIKINASHISLQGAVSFDSFSTSLVNTWNQMSNDVSTANTNASNAQKDAAAAIKSANTAITDATNAWNKAVSAATDASTAVTNAATAKQNAATAITNAASAVEKAGSVEGALNKLPSWSKEASIIKALESATVIVNGYISTSYIDVSNLNITNALSIGNFTWDGSVLKGSGDAAIQVSGGLGYLGKTYEHGNKLCYGYFSSLSADTLYTYGITLDGNLTISGTISSCTFTGSVSIGAGGSGYYQLKLYNSSNTLSWFIRTDNGMYLSFDGGTDNHKASFQYKDGVCNAWVSGAYNKGSDIRIKDRLDDITDILGKLDSLTPFRYKLKSVDSPLTFIGLSAQDVQSVFPEVVSETYYNEEFGNILALDYSVLSAVISVGGLKELHAKVKALEDRVKALEG